MNHLSKVLSKMMGMFYICFVQYSNHQPHVALELL